jgi:hypothetical protein
MKHPHIRFEDVNIDMIYYSTRGWLILGGNPRDVTIKHEYNIRVFDK